MKSKFTYSLAIGYFKLDNGFTSGQAFNFNITTKLKLNSIRKVLF